MIQDPTGQWIPWESFVERGWTLEYLRKKPKQDDVVEYVYNVKVLARERYRRCGIGSPTSA